MEGENNKGNEKLGRNKKEQSEEWGVEKGLDIFGREENAEGEGRAKNRRNG